MTDTRTTDGAISPPAHVDLWGFPRTRARVVVIPRSTGWRIGHAVGSLLLCWACIGIVMWVPPHFPWILTAFFLGIFFFQKYIRQRYTLVELAGTCPKCGAALTLKQPTRLGLPHRLHCNACHQAPLLEVELEGAPRSAPAESPPEQPGAREAGAA